MTTSDIIRKIRKSGFGYVCIERLDNNDRMFAWSARAERLDDLAGDFCTDDIVGSSIESVVKRLWKWIKDNRKEWNQ